MLMVGWRDVGVLLVSEVVVVNGDYTVRGPGVDPGAGL